VTTRVWAPRCAALSATSMPSPSGSTQSAMTKGIGDRLKASGRGARRGDGIDGVALSAQELGHDLAGGRLILDQQNALFSHCLPRFAACARADAGRLRDPRM